MISVIFASRVEGNRDSNIKNLLDSFTSCVNSKYYSKIEFLIKYDLDDKLAPPQSFFDEYPFKFKVFRYNRGEGRYYNHHHCEYLFLNRNPEYKWVFNVADDFIFCREGFVEEIEQIQNEYMIVGFTEPTFVHNSRIKIFQEKAKPENFSFENGMGEYCPLVTAKLMEVCQNFGWQANIDSWILLLNCMMYEMYGFYLWKKIPLFYLRTGSVFPAESEEPFLYSNVLIGNGNKLIENKYYFKVVEQQCRNIYLNIMHGNNIAPEHFEKMKEFWD